MQPRRSGFVSHSGRHPPCGPVNGALRRDEAYAVSRFLAIGDSFAAPDAERATRGWADALAVALRRLNPFVGYNNLATVGASSADVAEQQLPKALSLDPDLVTFCCGADEILTDAGLDVRVYARNVSRILVELRRGLPAATIITATYPDVARLLPLPLGSRAEFGRAIRQLNALTRSLARHHRVRCVDLALDRAITSCGGPRSSARREQRRLVVQAVLATAAHPDAPPRVLHLSR